MKLKKINKQTLKMALATTRSFAKKHGATASMIAGVLCFGAAIYFAAKEAPETQKELEAAEEIKGEKLNVVEKSKIVVRHQWRSIVAGAAGAGFIFGENYLWKNKCAELAAGYAVLSDKVKEYVAMNENTHFLDNKDISGTDIRAAGKMGNLNEVDDISKLGNKPAESPDESVTILDTWTGNLYRNASRLDIREAAVAINERIKSGPYASGVSVNSFYIQAGMRECKLGDRYFFDYDHPCSVKFGYGGDYDGMPCFTMDFANEPIPECREKWR